MKNSFILCMIILLFASCKHKSSFPLLMNTEASYVISLDKAIEDKKFSFENFNGNLRYVQLETTSESLLADIRFLGLLNDTIVIVDNAHQIMSFTNNGKFIGRIGREGSGPNEYNKIMSCNFDIKLGHVIVVDYRPRILRYDLKGNLVSSYYSDNKVFNTYADNSLFSNNYVFNFYNASTSNPYAHSYYGVKDSLKSDFINPHPMYKCNFSAWSKKPLTQLDDTIVFVKPLSDTIFQFVDGNITPRFVLQHKEPLLFQGKIDFYNNSDEDIDYQSYLINQQQNGFFVGIRDISETKDFLLFNMDYDINYLFCKSDQSLYKITGFKDIGTEDVLSIGKNSNRNSLIVAVSPSDVIMAQDFFLNIKKNERGAERLKKLPPEYERLILDFEEENNPIVIIATFDE